MASLCYARNGFQEKGRYQDRKEQMKKSILAVLLLLMLASCAKKPLKPADVSKSWSEKGTASWYGDDFKGKPTANGEPFDPEALTAAHKTLPLGTIVSIKNLDNGKKINLTINDRGPFVRGRIIDCSKKGARELGFLGIGTAQVKLEIVKIGEGRTGVSPTKVIDANRDVLDGSLTVQAGAFKDRHNAKMLKQQLQKNFKYAYVVEFHDFYRVRVGHFNSEQEAQQVLDTLSKQGIEGFLTRND
jgi:rare lipoprotein A